MVSNMSNNNDHVSALPTGYKFAMASVIDDAKNKGTEAKYHSSSSVSPICCFPYCLVNCPVWFMMRFGIGNWIVLLLLAIVGFA